MSGNITYGVTGVTIKDLYQEKDFTFVDTTEVHFKQISDNDILWYIDTEKNLLSIAGYALGGKASLFVDKIEGDFYNVLGLPISKLYSKLTELGYSISDFDLKN